MHILLICRILKTLAKKKPIDVKHKVQGILLDKVCGMVHCSLSVEMRDREASGLKFYIVDYEGGLLSDASSKHKGKTSQKARDIHAHTLGRSIASLPEPDFRALYLASCKLLMLH